MERRENGGGGRTAVDRRRFLGAGVAALGTSALAGCTDLLGDDEEDGPAVAGWIGSGPAGGRPTPGGSSMDEMPDLSGELTVYSGRNQRLVGRLVEFVEELYDDLALEVRYGNSAEMVNQILTEGENSPADVFYSVNAGSLGSLAAEGRTRELPGNVLDLVRQEFHDPDGHWIGTSGRARTIPYNTDEFSESDIPSDIFAFPEQSKFENAMGWAPSYGSFQAFVTAMRLLDGEQRTRAWLTGMQDRGIDSYPNEWVIANAVADGEISAGFTNHYYIQRVLAERPDAPLATAFTTGDAGAIFNVAGAAIVDTAADETLAGNFVRHLLSAEAQEYFATRTFEYPLVPEVEPVGQLPTIDELEPPENLDLTQLSELEPTLRLMRDVGLSV